MAPVKRFFKRKTGKKKRVIKATVNIYWEIGKYATHDVNRIIYRTFFWQMPVNLAVWGDIWQIWRY